MENWDRLSGKKKYFINYRGPGHKGVNAFAESQKFALEKAKEFGFITQGYTIDDIDNFFLEKNSNIFKQTRGAGYWIWKPYFIQKKLQEIDEGDFLIYMDSGAYFEKSPDDLLRMINHKGVLTFSLAAHKQSRWCKKDCFIEVFGNTEENFHDEIQILASFIFIRKCPKSLDFVNKWLELCQKEYLLTDTQSLTPNYPDFEEHRHDQALLSLLVYREDIMYVPDITQWCFEAGYDIPSRKIVEHHRLP